MGEITCAFCEGKGKDPFDLLSVLAVCQVCNGKGKVKVNDPMIKCSFCNGTGVYPRDGRVTCTVCNGKGSIHIESPVVRCSKCKGTGRTVDSGLPCVKCGGRGCVSRK